MASMGPRGGGGCQLRRRGGGGGGGGGGGFRAVAAAGGGGGGRRSDIALKHDIVLLGHLANGLGYYRFSYLGSSKPYVGVIAQEVQNLVPEAVTRGRDGYLRVYYEQLGLKLRYLHRLARRRRKDTRASGGLAMIMLNSLRRAASMGLGAIVAVALLTSASQAQQAYPSPEDAAAALAAAVKTGTRSTILKVLGKDAEDIIESGDDVADAEMRQRFLSAYDAKHSIKAEGNKKATLILGADDFPFPIPLVNNRTGWEFDPAAGRHRDSVSSHRTQ